MSICYILEPDGTIRETDDMLDWAEFYKDSARRRVALTGLPDCEVSTVFLGLDHNFGGHGPPVLFETFGGPLDGEQDRYTSLADAQAGHAAWVARARS